jgi:hypothetical protein
MKTTSKRQPVRLRFITVAAVAATLSSCGVQLGKFTSSGGFAGLEPEFGILAYERGSPWGSSGPDKNLLYIVVICPGVKVHPPSGSAQQIGRFTSSQRCWWSTDSGQIEFSYSWNRVFDSVRILGFGFDRAAGNAFVARRTSNGRWAVEQLAYVSTDLTLSEALRQIQRQLPQDRSVGGLTLAYP